MVEMRGGRAFGVGDGGRVAGDVPIVRSTEFAFDISPGPPGTQTAQGARSCGDVTSTPVPTCTAMVSGRTSMPSRKLLGGWGTEECVAFAGRRPGGGPIGAPSTSECSLGSASV